MKKLYFIISLVLTHPALAKPLALVYDGPGACKPGCVYGAARVAIKAGFRVKFVGPSLNDYTVFDRAKLWVQPGGTSVTAAGAMGPALMQKVREFVANGGGYVGFCAGAFISTKNVGQSDSIGYGMIPGETELLVQSGNDHRMLLVTLPDGSTRWEYYAGGPYFKVSDEALKAVDGEVIARYPDGSIAGVHAHYGKGKVAVTGFHPEAGFFWELLEGQVNPSGIHLDFAVNMINYATTP